MQITTPGRICLFGEHQDYLGLPIIALAISLRSKISAVKRKDRNIIINMPDLDKVEKFSLEDLSYSKERDYFKSCLLYTSPSPRDATLSRMPSSA